MLSLRAPSLDSCSHREGCEEAHNFQYFSLSVTTTMIRRVQRKTNQCLVQINAIVKDYTARQDGDVGVGRMGCDPGVPARTLQYISRRRYTLSQPRLQAL